MWYEFLHHITLHFPIVLSMALAATGLYALRTDSDAFIPVLRWAGHLTLAITTVAVLSGLLAGGFTGGEETLQHHRYLGVLAFVVIALAALSYDYGVRHDISDFRSYGICLWWVASFAVIGAGHWGGLAEHRDVIPF